MANVLTRIWIAILLIIVTLSCVAQTATEFRNMVRDHGGFLAKMETITVDRPFSKVNDQLKKKMVECTNATGTLVTAAPAGGMHAKSVATTKYKGKYNMISPTYAEMTVQFRKSGMVGKMPDDGIYLLVADLEALGKSKSKLTIYVSEATNTAAALKRWAKGENQECPELP